MYLKTYFLVFVLVFHINSSVAQYFANRPPYDDTPLSIPVAVVYDKPVLTLRPYKKAKVTTYRPKYSVVTEISSIREETFAEDNREEIKPITEKVNVIDVQVKATEAGVTQTEAILTETEEAVIATESIVTKNEAAVTATEEAVITTETVVTETEAVVTATEAYSNENEAALTETSVSEETTKLPTYRRIYKPRKFKPTRKYTDISKLREERNKKVAIQESKQKIVVSNEYQVPVVVVYDDQDESRRNFLSQPQKYKKITQRRRYKTKVTENTENIITAKEKTESPQIITTKESATEPFETSTAFEKIKVINTPSALSESANYKTSTAVYTKEPIIPFQRRTAAPQNLEPTMFVNTRVMNRPVEITTSKSPSAFVTSRLRTQRRRLKVKTTENADNTPRYSKSSTTISYSEERTGSPKLIKTQESTKQNSESFTSVVNTKVTDEPSTTNIDNVLKSSESSSGFVKARVSNRPLVITETMESVQPSTFVTKTRTQRRRFKVKPAENTDNAPRYSKSSTTVSYTEKETGSPQTFTTQESTKQNSETFTSVVNTKVTDDPSTTNIDNVLKSSESSSGFVKARVSNRPLVVTETMKSVQLPTAIVTKTRTQRRRFKVKPAENTDNAPRYSKDSSTVSYAVEETGSPQILTTQGSTKQNSETFTSVVNTKVTDEPSTTKIENVQKSSESSSGFVKARVSNRPLVITETMESVQPPAFVTKTRTQRRRFKVKPAENTDNSQNYSKTVVNTGIITEPSQIVTTEKSETQNLETSTNSNTIVTSITPQIITVTESTLQNSENFALAVNTRVTNRLPEITTENTVIKYVLNTEEKLEPIQIVKTTESTPQNFGTFTSVVNTKISSKPSQTLAAKESSTVVNAQITSRSSQQRTAEESSPQNSRTFSSFENTRTSNKPSQTLAAKESSAVVNAQITSRSSQLRTAKESSPQNSGTFTSFGNTRVSSRIPQITVTESALPNSKFSTVVTTGIRSKSSQIIESAPQNSGSFASVVNTRVTRRPSTITAKEAVTVVPKVFPKRTYEYVKTPLVPIVDSESYVFSDSGNYHYSYEGADGTKAFERGELKEYNNDLTGEAVVGGFSYKDKDGNDFSLSYTADENGYRPVGAHLPTPPPIPPAIARALEYLATKTTDPVSTTESL